MNIHQYLLIPFVQKVFSKKKPFFHTFFIILSIGSLVSGTGCPSTGKSTNKARTSPVAHVFVNDNPVVRLEIHHININNGDASVIRLIHKDKTETKVLIDGGEPNVNESLLPYINAMFLTPAFQYTILTHYHKDHYQGLKALGDGTIQSKFYIDPGGYNMKNYVNNDKLDQIQPKDTSCLWTNSAGVFNKNGMGEYIMTIGKAANNYGLKRYMPMSMETAHIQELIGVKIPLGVFMRGNTRYEINLRCVAAWGYTQGDNEVVNDWVNNDKNENNASLAFVLECGEFRYFFGGDMGGGKVGDVDEVVRNMDGDVDGDLDCGMIESYINQETTLAAGFAYLYKGAKSYYNPGTTFDGHICGFKANHHGSAHSNSNIFLGQMRPAVCITSAGSNTNWHLPSVSFIERLDKTSPVTLATDIPRNSLPFSKAQGFFFTNLYKFKGVNNSQKKAIDLFGNSLRSKTAFKYGNETWE